MADFGKKIKPKLLEENDNNKEANKRIMNM